MSAELQFPDIKGEMVAAQGAAAGTAPIAPLTAVDLTKMALSRFDQNWRVKAKELVTRYDGVVYDATTTKGYNDLKAAIAEVRAPRYAAQNVSKASKSELAAVSRAVGVQEKAIIEYLSPTEQALVAQLEAEDTRRAAAKAAKEQAERERVARHEGKLELIRGYVKGANKVASTNLQIGIDKLAAMTFGPEWEEDADQARGAQEATLVALREILQETLAREQREAEVEAQRLANEAEKQRLAEERRRLAEEQRARDQAEKQRLAQVPAVQNIPTAAAEPPPPIAPDRPTTGSAEPAVRTAAETRIAAANMVAVMFGSFTHGGCWSFTPSGLADLIDFVLNRPSGSEEKACG
jgi:hypothetical protein